MKMQENVNDLLNMIDEAMDEGRKVPFMDSQRIVDIEAVHEILDEIRKVLPEELKQATVIVKDRATIISQANKKAEQIMQNAEERARVLVGEQQITKAAQAKAAEILSSAQSEARQMRSTINEYCESRLKKLEDDLAQTSAAMKTLRESLKQK